MRAQDGGGSTRSTGPKGLADTRIIAALRANGGIIAHAAAQLGVDRSGLHRRIERSTKLRDALRDIEETMLDSAEGVVMEAIHTRRDVATARWYLSTKGRGRGYGSQDVTMTDEELQRLVSAVAVHGVDALRRLRDMVAYSPSKS